MMKHAAFGLAILLAGCSSAQQAQVVAFEARAEPVIQSACARLHQVEANPLEMTVINLGVAAANGASGGIAGGAFGIIKSFGDAYCLQGPPPGDTTSAAQQADWLLNQVIAPLTGR
jgi:hypothetical protein